MASKSFIRKIISNPVIQTMAMYVSGGWILIELVEYFIVHFNLNERFRIIFLIVMLCGLPLAMIIAWLVNRERKETTEPARGKKPSGTFARIFRHTVYSVPSMVVVLLLIVFGIRTVNRHSKIKWAREEALVQVEELLNERNLIPAFDLLKKAERYISKDVDYTRLEGRVISKWTVITDPPGADIYVREYADSTKKWEWLGRSPIDSMEMPSNTFYLMRMEKPDYEPVVAAVPTNDDTVYRRLFKAGEIPEGMVHVYGFSRDFSEGILAPKRDFFIDKYEVTNQQYKAFIEQGGIKTRITGTRIFTKMERSYPGKRPCLSSLTRQGGPDPRPGKPVITRRDRQATRYQGSAGTKPLPMRSMRGNPFPPSITGNPAPDWTSCISGIIMPHKLK